jgi:hypothetical protein
MGIIMCLRSWGLIQDSPDDGDGDDDSGNDDVRKDRWYGMPELDEVQADSQAI